MIYLGADHNGFKYKEKIKQYLEKRSLGYIDLGAGELDPKDDYPDYAFLLAKKTVADLTGRGILLCGSGNGMAIAANKIKGARAALVWNKQTARQAVADDHANILVLPAKFISSGSAVGLVDRWLKSRPSRAARHVRRVAKVNKLGQKVWP